MLDGVEQKIQQSVQGAAGAIALAVALLCLGLVTITITAVALWHSLILSIGSVSAWWLVALYFLAMTAMFVAAFLFLSKSRKKPENAGLSWQLPGKLNVVTEALEAGEYIAPSMRMAIRRYPRGSILVAFVGGYVLAKRSHLIGPLARIILRLL